ncbi:MAG: nucleotidyltransferase family protein [Gemmatimonadota bacterium]
MARSKIIDGIVLAAGASRRMGEPKALLEMDGSTFLERAIHLLREGGCRYVVAVVTDDLWIERLADVSGAAVIINDAEDAEQVDSLRLGIANLPEDSDGVMVLPVDFPRISVETVKKLVREFDRTDAPILNPAYNGVAGHPVVFARRILPELLEPKLAEGARSVMDAHQREVHGVDVADPGVLIDVDTPEDYQQHVQRGKSNNTV